MAVHFVLRDCRKRPVSVSEASGLALFHVVIGAPATFVPNIFELAAINLGKAGVCNAKRRFACTTLRFLSKNCKYFKYFAHIETGRTLILSHSSTSLKWLIY
jgi:hypothetical protein